MKSRPQHGLRDRSTRNTSGEVHYCIFKSLGPSDAVMDPHKNNTMWKQISYTLTTYFFHKGQKMLRTWFFHLCGVLSSRKQSKKSTKWHGFGLPTRESFAKRHFLLHSTNLYCSIVSCAKPCGKRPLFGHKRAQKRVCIVCLASAAILPFLVTSPDIQFWLSAALLIQVNLFKFKMWKCLQVVSLFEAANGNRHFRDE